MPKPPPRIPKPVPPKVPKIKSKKTPPSAPTKIFAVKPWTGKGEGEKIVCYAKTGMGKTTITSMMPNPVFVGLDDGGRRIVNPKTQQPINHIPGIETYEDVQSVIRQINIFPKGSSCVIDTFTLFELLIERHVLETIHLPKGGGIAPNLKAYGWNDGSSHTLDACRLILQDLDTLVRRGVNICLICQEQAIIMPNPEGLDFLVACPKLHHDRQYSSMMEVCAWADHIFRIDYLNTTVRADTGKSVGKIASGQDVTRAIYIGGAPDRMAKSRTLNRFVTEDDEPIDCVSFDNPADDSLWTFIFNEEEE